MRSKDKLKKQKEKNEKTRKIILYSLLLIVASAAVFIGATYAWFSDSVTTENNKITSGNLDIELYHTKSGVREKINEETKLFDMALWEPGAVVYENFEIVNEGSLALYYNFAFNVVKFNSVNETEKSLKDVLKVAIVDGEFSGDRTAAKELDYISTIKDFVMKNPLKEKGESQKFAVVVYWEPSDTDNEYNLNNGKTSSDGQPLYIDLGISLEARQYTQEEDSFGNDYDAFEISTSMDLYNGLKSKNGEILRLTKDVNYIARTLTFKDNVDAVIDLNNHTLSGTPIIKVGNNSKLVIKNGTLKLNLEGNSLVQPTFYVYDSSSVTLENVHYVSDTASGITPLGTTPTININNCTFNTVGYAISTNASDPNRAPIINIKNSHFIASSNPNHAGTPILFNVNGQLNIEDSVIEGHYQGIFLRGGTAVIKNSKITNNVDSLEYVNKYKDINWGGGSLAPVAAITMGNKYSNTTSYKYPTNVTLINTILDSGNDVYPEVYAYGNTEDGLGVTFNYDGTSTVGNVVVGNDKVVINGVNAPVNE